MFLNKCERFIKCMLAIAGGILVGMGEVCFLIPLKLTTGGFNGIGMLLYYLCDIPVSLVSICLNLPLFFISAKILGKQYSLRTLLSMISLSLTLQIGTSWTPLTNDMFLAAVFGGLIIGIGIAVAIKGESTTGGTDLLAKIIQAKNRHINLGEIILIIDGLIIAFATFTFESIEIALYSGIAVFVMTKVMDFILDGGRYAKAVFIISEKSQEISNYIMQEVKRGVTYINGKGAYSMQDKNILFCVANKREIPKIKDKIMELDDKAFVIVTTVSEAIGQGFEKF